MVRRLLATGAAVALVGTGVWVWVATTADSSRRTASPGRLVLWSGSPADCRLQLLRVDPNSLKPLPGRRVAVPQSFAEPTLSPDHKLAVVDGENHGSLNFVDLTGMTRAGSVRLGGAADFAETLAWPRKRMLVALDVDRDAHRVGLTKVAVVDPLARRTLGEVRFPWWADLGHGTTASGRTAVLLVSWTRLLSPRLVVVEPSGSIRQIRVPGFRVGVGVDRIGEIRRFPAFAVDPENERAYLALEREPVAVIDLRSLRIRYRHFPLPVPARSELGPIENTGTNDPTHGPQREAAWLGNGKFALAGFDSVTENGGERDAGAGLAIVDTLRRKVTTLRAGSFSFQPGTPRVVAIGFSPKKTDHLPQSLFLLGPTGKLVRAVRTPHGWSLVAGRIAVPVSRRRRWEILDATTGRMVGHAPLRRVQAIQPGYC